MAGQRRAITRALENSGVSAEDIGFVVAHATGTPAGDLAELTGLRDCYPGRAPVPVVSNKSLIGHTGWAAGVVSVIHLLLALQHETIPAQYRFRDAPRGAELDGPRLTVPRAAVEWRAGRSLRTGAVSGFGFGGTNAHLLLREHGPDAPATHRYRTHDHGDLVLVGWASRLPGATAGFGNDYPAPSRDELRLPPPTVRRLDRTQLMLVQCVYQLEPPVREALSRRGERAGVVVGHAGPTRNAVLFNPERYGSITLGDAAGAIILRKDPASGSLLLDSTLTSDGARHDVVVVPPTTGWVQIAPDLPSHAVPGQAEAARILLERNHLTIDDIDWVVPHPGTDAIHGPVREAVGVPPEKFVTNFSTRGNTGSASIPIVLSAYHQSGQFRRGDLVLALAVGSGWYSGGLLLRF